MGVAKIVLCLVRAAGREARMDEVFFGGVDLSETVLDGMDLSGSVFAHVDFQGANLRGADLSGACLCHADLSGADLGDSIDGTDMHKSRLDGATLRGVRANRLVRALAKVGACYEALDWVWGLRCDTLLIDVWKRARPYWRDWIVCESTLQGYKGVNKFADVVAMLGYGSGDTEVGG